MSISKTAPSIVSGLPGYSGPFECAVAKTQRNLPALAQNPASWAYHRNGNYSDLNEGFFDIGNWTTSFFTGMAAIATLHTGDPRFGKALQPLDPWYQKKIGTHAADTMHDLGFLYSLYAVALYKVTQDPHHRQTALRAADQLAARFIAGGNYIRAWGRMDESGTDYDGVAIIDSLMNLPLLYWASAETGNPHYRDIAVKHADTTLELFLRPDGSVFHAYRFDPQSNNPVGGENYCGRSIDSHWARGTAWAIYGFSLSHLHTGDSRYLEASLKLADHFVARLDDEVVPVWDFSLAPGEPPLRDSSAAAIAACGIQELALQGEAPPSLCSAKDAMLAKLCSPDYFDPSPEVAGLIRNGQVGDGIGRAQSVYTSWGDYFFMEALAREIGIEITWW